MEEGIRTTQIPAVEGADQVHESTQKVQFYEDSDNQVLLEDGEALLRCFPLPETPDCFSLEINGTSAHLAVRFSIALGFGSFSDSR